LSLDTFEKPDDLYLARGEEVNPLRPLFTARARGRARAPLRGRRRARAPQRTAAARRHPPPRATPATSPSRPTTASASATTSPTTSTTAASTSASPAAPSLCRASWPTSQAPSCSTGMRRRCSGAERHLGFAIVILVRHGDTG